MIDTYDLGAIGDDLERRWLAPREDRSSLRELAEEFNRVLLGTELERAGVETLDGEVANLYHLLTGDVGGGSRTEARRHLERHGIDVDALTDDFVSRQAIHTYLTKQRGVEYASRERDPVDRERQHVDRLRRHTVAVTESKLAQLRKNEDLHLGDVTVLCSLQVYCETCCRQYEISELFDMDGCECE